jgi:hypothetical protein
MRHPTDGTLRRLLDEPAGVADTDRDHVAGCPVCRSALAAAHRDAQAAAQALHHDVTADVDAGWRRLSGAVAAEPRRVTTGRAPRWRTALRSPVIAGVAAVALLGGAGAAVAGDWLPIFRTETIAPITLTPADLVQLPDLSAYGTVEVQQEPQRREVPDAATAQEITGLSVPRVADLPRGVTGAPRYLAGKRMTATFTFSAERAARTAAAAGEALPPPPAGLDGSRFLLSGGPGLAAVWSGASGAPAMVVARVVAPTVHSAGVPFTTARDYLLTLPGLPESVAAQLRSLSGDGTTLPLIVKAGQQTSTAADVRGTPATVLTTRDGVIAGVVWVDGGVVTAVAGSLSADEVLTVARELR